MREVRGTADQVRAITTLDRDLCVVAGAGTGKTHVLTEHVLSLVLDGGVPLRNVLAITFTEKAAAEMRGRLASAFAASRGAPGVDARRVPSRDDVDEAAISTVHAFCARLLRDHAVAAGVDPGFRVLDEVEADRLLDEAFHSFTDLLRESDPGSFGTLATLGGDDPGETLLSVYREAQASGLPVGAFVRHVAGLPSAEEAIAPLRLALAALEAHRGAGTEGTQRIVAAVLEAARALPPDDAPPADLEAAVPAVAGAVKLNCSREVKGALAAVRAAADEALPVLAEHAMAPLRDVVAAAVERLDSLYDAAKGRGERLDFADLERRAVAVLESSADVRDAVRRRWTHVLVDEFQDTNPVQARLVELLRSPARLFVVGDPKQSIYGFRGADVQVFEEHLAAVAAQGRDGVVTLRDSFRSRPETLGFVNALFRDGVGGATGPGGEVALAAGRAWAPAAGPCVDVHVVAADSLGEAREAEAAWIADRIAALCDGTFRIAAPAPEDPLRTRAAGFGDVAVLLRATTHVKTLESALVARGVPYVVVKGRGFFLAREVIDVAHLLACVDGARDDLVLASVLRSPACGVSDDGLFALAAARRRLPPPSGEGTGDPAREGNDVEPLADVLDAWRSGERAVEGLPSDDAGPLREFLDVFADLRARRGTDAVDALVERAFDRLRLDVLALGRPNGRQRAANLRKVRCLAREAAADGLSLAEFVAELRDLRAREVREAEAAVAAGASGAVNLLTVHAAKGLEFPIVFVPDLARGERARSGPIRADVRAGVGLRSRAGAPHDAPAWAFARIEAIHEAKERAEADRLLYVATTRAADHLVLTAAMRADDAERDPADDRRVWRTRLARVAGTCAPVPEVRDVDVGPAAVRHGADDGPVPRSILRLHPPAGAGAGLSGGARNLLGRVFADVATGHVPPLPLRPDAVAAAEALRAEAARRAPPPDGTAFAVNVSALTAFARCPQEYRLRYVVGVPEDAGPRLFGARTAFDVDEAPAESRERPGDEDEAGTAPDARALGRAVHAALERLVPSFASDVAAEVADALRAETGGAAPDPDQVGELVRWVEAFRRSDLGREVASAARADVRREQALLFRAGRTTVRGQIDLLWGGERGWTVVDYKTGAAERPEHVLQMRLYALGVEAVTGRAPRRLVLWSLPRGAGVSVPFGPEERTEVEGLLGEFARRTAARDYTPGGSPPCAACSVRAACRWAPAANPGIRP